MLHQTSGRSVAAVSSKPSRASARRLDAGAASPRGVLRRFQSDRRGAVGVIVGLSAVPLMMALCMGLELVHGTTVKAELQRTADVAALAGAQQYFITNNTQGSAIAAAMLAELNGGAGGTARTWNDPTLSDNQITVQVGDRTSGSSSKAVTVTVSQAMPLFFSGLMPVASLTVSATARAAVTPSMQPCVLALSSVGSGIQAQGNPSVTLTECSMRSNASITNGGSSSFSASGFYAAGSITGSETGTPLVLVPQDGTISDPYAGNLLVQNAISQTQLSGASLFQDTPSQSHTLPLLPGQNTFTNWSIKGTVRLQPGIYYIYGDITIGAGASLIGNGVTIVTTGSFSMGGNSTVTLSAATMTTKAQNGAILGFVFISNSTGPTTFGGGSTATLSGAFYKPNGDLSFAGTPQGGSTGCLQVVAKSVTLVGNSSMASTCSDYGPSLTFSSEDKSTVALFK